MQDYIGRPLLQIVFFTLLSAVIMPIARPKNADSVYAIAGGIYAAFVVVNSILLFFAPRTWPYFFQSMLASIIYLLVAALLAAMYLSITKTKGSSEGAMVFLVVLYHPPALLLAIFLQWAVRLLRAH